MTRRAQPTKTGENSRRPRRIHLIFFCQWENSRKNRGENTTTHENRDFFRTESFFGKERPIHPKKKVYANVIRPPDRRTSRTWVAIFLKTCLTLLQTERKILAHGYVYSSCNPPSKNIPGTKYAVHVCGPKGKQKQWDLLIPKICQFIPVFLYDLR